MEKIIFWKDKENRKIDPTLYSKQAETLAEELAKNNKQNSKVNKRTQIRKFYDEVTRLDTEAKSRSAEWDDILPLVHMLTAKAAYALGRGLVSKDFVSFVRGSIDQISRKEDLSIFANFFEAFMGFYRHHGPAN